MNEFIEQFLIECRELVTQATDDLLALEENPSQRDRLDSAFRAFHTLKGAAGIVDFDAMGRALHAAEDVLSSVRAGDGQVTAQLIGDCLTCLDQVVQWLDEIRSEGEIPSRAEVQAEAIVRRFSQSIEAPPGPFDENLAASGDWPERLRARYPEAAGRAATAIRFAPDAESFMRGEDPLALLAELPGLVALDIAPVGDGWPSLEAFDPFACQMVLCALSSGDLAGVRTHLAPVAHKVQLQALQAVGDFAVPGTARALIEAQILLLADPEAEPAAGRTASARAVAVNVLRSLGRLDDAQILATTDAADLAGALRSVLAGVVLAAGPGDAPAPRASQEVAARALRVDVERIDALVNLTGELTVAKNALAHAAALAQDGADSAGLGLMLRTQHAQLSRLVGDLQRSVLNIRVLPLRQVFQRFPRLLREMVGALGKPARLLTEGDETEADKAIVENLFEPLLHVLRNALDHGVEPPDVRAAAGKPPSATIVLRASREGSQVVVEVVDDGAGIDVARVRAVAAERGVVAPEVLAEMTDEAAADLIFAPGFSTATQVTSLSGRGVGMDAVRSTVERMGGRVTLLSAPGQGTTVRLTLPFTVLMSSVMTVEAGGQMFGIPLEAMIETLRLPRSGISGVGAAHAFVWRNRTLPLIDLGEALDERRVSDSAGDAHVVVTSTLGQFAGLEVDRIGERMDVMLKPMEGLLAGMRGIAGTTLLGDGRVLLVLDLQALLQ